VIISFVGQIHKLVFIHDEVTDFFPHYS
jgi:hypothetical protein